jgi:hypothetical protein
MIHKIIILKTKINEIPVGTKGTIIHEYKLKKGFYEIEFIFNDKSVTEIVHENDFEIENYI